jgi:hypothetical protein
MIDAGFVENFAGERYFFEMITAIITYEKILTKQIFPNTPVSAKNEPIRLCLFLTE